MKHRYCDWHIPVLGYLNIWKHATFSFRSCCASCAPQVALVVKNLPANAGVVRDMGSIPGVGRSPGGGHGNSLLYSCLENPMDREVWQATVHRVAQNRTWLKWHSTYIYLMGSWFLDQGSNSCSLKWKHRVLTTGPPGNSQHGMFLNESVSYISKFYDIEFNNSNNHNDANCCSDNNDPVAT